MARKQATDDFDAASLAFLRLMLRRTPEFGVMFADETGTITGWNHGAQHITGFSAQEAIGHHAGLFFTEEDRARGMHLHELEEARAKGFSVDERWHARRDGGRFWSSGVMLHNAAEDGGGFFKVFRDASHLQSRIQSLQNIADEHNGNRNVQNDVIARTAHEIRNPLAPLKNVHALLAASPDVAGTQARPLAIFQRQLSFLERMVEDLVDTARVVSGKLTIDIQPTVLQPALRAALESCRPRAEERGVALDCVLPEVPIEVCADAARLQQVVINLLNNAIKFTPPGGSVWLTCSADQTHCMVQVTDDGEGIEPDLLPRIFDMFTQAHAGPARHEGLGVGLSLVKEIVAQHRGTVEVRSDGRDKGSVFNVRIPLRHAAPQAG